MGETILHRKEEEIEITINESEIFNGRELSLQNGLNLYSTWRICSRAQRKKQLDWLATNTDNITIQSHSTLLVRATTKWKTAQSLNG
jgi:hypothetical protein